MEQRSGQMQQGKLKVRELKQLFVKCANEYLMRCEGKPFEVYDRTLLNGLFLYFTGSPNSPYDLRKGLWLEGIVGAGKTTLMNVFREFRVTFSKGFLLSTAAEIACGYSESGSLDTYVNNAHGYSRKPITLCVDELGREPIPAMHYGNKLNVMQHILHQRYNLWQSRGVVTHVTTNLTAKEIINRYDYYVFDRCRQMFNIITINGCSKR